MDLTDPSVDALYNYDTDRDASPGLVIAKGGSGVYESDPAKYQVWRTPEFSEDVLISGEATLHLWSATKNFEDGKIGRVVVFLRDFDGWSYVELGGLMLTESNWQGGSASWRNKTFTFPVGPYTVAAGHSLELKVIVDGVSDDDMWFAYDTSPNRSRVAIPSLGQGPPD